MALVLCASCSRHVKLADAACPFCGAHDRAPVARPRSRASRAAIVLGGAVLVSAGVACSENGPSTFEDAGAADASQRSDASGVPLYGLASDGSIEPDADAEADADAAPVAMYGAAQLDASADTSTD